MHEQAFANLQRRPSDEGRLALFLSTNRADEVLCLEERA